MEDKRIQVMTILQDYFCKDTPLDVATDSILRLFSVVGRSEQLLLNECPNKDNAEPCRNGGICPDCIK
jgi:hypothetical protein